RPVPVFSHQCEAAPKTASHWKSSNNTGPSLELETRASPKRDALFHWPQITSDVGQGSPSSVPTTFPAHLHAFDQQLDFVPATPEDFPAGAAVVLAVEVAATLGDSQQESRGRQFAGCHLGQHGHRHDPLPGHHLLQFLWVVADALSQVA